MLTNTTAGTIVVRNSQLVVVAHVLLVHLSSRGMAILERRQATLWTLVLTLTIVWVLPGQLLSFLALMWSACIPVAEHWMGEATPGRWKAWSGMPMKAGHLALRATGTLRVGGTSTISMTVLAVSIVVAVKVPSAVLVGTRAIAFANAYCYQLWLTISIDVKPNHLLNQCLLVVSSPGASATRASSSSFFFGFEEA